MRGFKVVKTEFRFYLLDMQSQDIVGHIEVNGEGIEGTRIYLWDAKTVRAFNSPKHHDLSRKAINAEERELYRGPGKPRLEFDIKSKRILVKRGKPAGFLWRWRRKD